MSWRRVKTAGKGDASLKLSRFVSATVRKEMATGIAAAHSTMITRISSANRLFTGTPNNAAGEVFSCPDRAANCVEYQGSVIVQISPVKFGSAIKEPTDFEFPFGFVHAPVVGQAERFAWLCSFNCR